MNFTILPVGKLQRSRLTVRFAIEYTKATDKSLAEVTLKEFSGKKLSSVVIRKGQDRTLYVGLGAGGDVLPDTYRRAAGLAIRQARKLGFTTMAVDLKDHEDHVAEVVEGLEIGAYEFIDFRSEDSPFVNLVEILVSGKELKKVSAAVGEGSLVGQAVNYTRQIGNQPGNVVTPEVLAKRALEAARKYKLKATVLDAPKLRAGGFNGILAVGGGSKNEPRLIALEYRGAKNKTAKPLALIGKAITFDSGGISLKPGEAMDEMKFDKMGGVAVLGAICAIAAMKLPVNIVALISSAENMPSSNAYRPGDIIRSYDGKTIEVLNTDAEGRIVLVDAIAYARKHYKPQAMIDLATLTGACIVALGQYKAGLFSNNEDFLMKVQLASEQSAEPVWHMPLGPEYHEQIKSDVALVKNIGGRYGGAVTAAAFLETWAGDTPWAHLDIAGTAWTTKEHPHLAKGATGYGVRLLVELARQFAA